MSERLDNAAHERAPFEQHDERILRLPEVMLRTGLSRSSIYAYVRLGLFPVPVRLGARAVGWLKSEVDRWIADRAAALRRLTTVE